eukprot:CAMPEP_0168534656 /NCGR_PEP_ID=MMETSP0405-20121227/18089_1 /TAXON_ID=498012 /ORGANISM="Trichosphaerium sp, Strain Am-I-7 wt" /LENGTH=67 /DNA_ID=CAMNT_0008561523 /DNA_START=239 /DNA_END=438 /DNA_ORIENTATION=-
MAYSVLKDKIVQLALRSRTEHAPKTYSSTVASDSRPIFCVELSIAQGNTDELGEDPEKTFFMTSKNV